MRIELETKVKVFFEDCIKWEDCKGQNGINCFGCNGHHHGRVTEMMLVTVKLNYFTEQLKQSQRHYEQLLTLGDGNE